MSWGAGDVRGGRVWRGDPAEARHRGGQAAQRLRLDSLPVGKQVSSFFLYKFVEKIREVVVSNLRRTSVDVGTFQRVTFKVDQEELWHWLTLFQDFRICLKCLKGLALPSRTWNWVGPINRAQCLSDWFWTHWYAYCLLPSSGRIGYYVSNFLLCTELGLVIVMFKYHL